MPHVRKPLQGVFNILRFNWHFFVGAVVVASLLALISNPLAHLFAILIILTTLISLVTSYLIYDRSSLYDLNWLDSVDLPPTPVIVNISAGFDETTALLKSKLHHAEFHIWDFYDPEKHTEISVQRARKAYPTPPATQQVDTRSLPLESSSVDLVCLHMAAHEIRDGEERRDFFAELRRIVGNDGTVCVTEHLRDAPNYFAYTFGAFHFLPKSEWLNVFETAGFEVVAEQKVTPFVSTFLLRSIFGG